MSSASAAGPGRRTNDIEQILDELRRFNGDIHWQEFIPFMERLFGEAEEWKDRNSLREIRDEVWHCSGCDKTAYGISPLIAH
eukprot:12928871-Prorocentrum_lima.AAC.1